MAPGHALVVPIEEIDHWVDAPPELAAHLFAVAHRDRTRPARGVRLRAGRGDHRRLRGAAHAHPRDADQRHERAELRERRGVASIATISSRWAAAISDARAALGGELERQSISVDQVGAVVAHVVDVGRHRRASSGVAVVARARTASASDSMSSFVGSSHSAQRVRAARGPASGRGPPTSCRWRAVVTTVALCRNRPLVGVGRGPSTRSTARRRPTVRRRCGG